MVDGDGDWGERWNANSNQFDNLGMLAGEQIKHQKHGTQYACTGYSFVTFVCSFKSFGVLRPTTIRYLWALVMLEIRQHSMTLQYN
jgi:hypothetical protein